MRGPPPQEGGVSAAHLVGEPHGDHVLHHLLAQVVVDAVDLLLPEQRPHVGRQGLRGRQVPAERLLDDHAAPAGARLAVLVNALRDRLEHGGRQREVEAPVGLGLGPLEPLHRGRQALEGRVLVVLPAHVRAPAGGAADCGAWGRCTRGGGGGRSVAPPPGGRVWEGRFGEGGGPRRVAPRGGGGGAGKVGLGGGPPQSRPPQGGGGGRVGTGGGVPAASPPPGGGGLGG